MNWKQSTSSTPSGQLVLSTRLLCRSVRLLLPGCLIIQENAESDFYVKSFIRHCQLIQFFKKGNPPPPKQNKTKQKPPQNQKTHTLAIPGLQLAVLWSVYLYPRGFVFCFKQSSSKDLRIITRTKKAMTQVCHKHWHQNYTILLKALQFPAPPIPRCHPEIHELADGLS